MVPVRPIHRLRAERTRVCGWGQSANRAEQGADL